MSEQIEILPEYKTKYSNRKRANNHTWEKSHPLEAREMHHKYKQKRKHYYWAHASIYAHKKSGLIINISPQELENIAKASIFCKYCGTNLNFNQRKGGLLNESPTLDRTNNDQILNKESVQIICRLCNSTKQNRTHEEFINYCRMIGNKFPIGD
jgi:hypothetical protein